jgi:hypothetical protein
VSAARRRGARASKQTAPGDSFPHDGSTGRLQGDRKTATALLKHGGGALGFAAAGAMVVRGGVGGG